MSDDMTVEDIEDKNYTETIYALTTHQKFDHMKMMEEIFNYMLYCTKKMENDMDLNKYVDITRSKRCLAHFIWTIDKLQFREKLDHPAFPSKIDLIQKSEAIMTRYELNLAMQQLYCDMTDLYIHYSSLPGPQELEPTEALLINTKREGPTTSNSFDDNGYMGEYERDTDIDDDSECSDMNTNGNISDSSEGDAFNDVMQCYCEFCMKDTEESDDMYYL